MDSFVAGVAAKEDIDQQADLKEEKEEEEAERGRDFHSFKSRSYLLIVADVTLVVCICVP